MTNAFPLDGPSMDPAGSPQLPAHRLLLDAGVNLLERRGLDLGLDLDRGLDRGRGLGRAAPGDYELCCLPLALRGSDGAPACAAPRDTPGRSRARGHDG